MITRSLVLSLILVALLASPVGAQAVRTVSQVSITAANLLAAILTVDGAGSGIDADFLDGAPGSAYALLSGATFTGDFIFSASGISGAQAVSGTTTSWRVPTGVSTAALTKPACAASTDEGSILYVQDNASAVRADLCMCGLWTNDVAFTYRSLLYSAAGVAVACTQ